VVHRREFLVTLAGVAVATQAAPAWAGRQRRPYLEVEVQDNNPLKMTLRDIIASPVSAVRSTIDDLGSWVNWVPLFTKSDVIAQQGSHRSFDARLDLPWPVADRTFVADVAGRKTGFDLSYVPGSGNMKDFFITVEILPWTDAGTLVQSSVEADFGIPLTKGFIEWLARRKAPQMFSALETRAANA
jgi:hypothetical protein